jgi:hypothetical protein
METEFSIVKKEPRIIRILSELIVNSKLATAGPRHFELQKYPPKRKLYEKNSYFTRDSKLGPQKLLIFDLPTFH